MLRAYLYHFLVINAIDIDHLEKAQRGTDRKEVELGCGNAGVKCEATELH